MQRKMKAIAVCTLSVVFLHGKQEQRVQPPIRNEAMNEAMSKVTVDQVAVGAVDKSKVLSNESDPYLWLEGVEDPRALAWVDQFNQKTAGRLQAHPLFSEIYTKTLEVLDSEERIPLPSVRKGYVYDFWQDATHVRGLWRRTPVEEYKRNKIQWEVLLDVDQLAEAEGESWVFKGASCLRSDDRQCLVSLSRGGKDAKVVREYDLTSQRFLTEGFVLPESKGNLGWIDKDTVFVTSDFGEGSLTKSGYPRLVKVWKRGEPLAAAPTVFSGDVDDVAASFMTLRDEGKDFHFIEKSLSFYTSQLFSYGDGKTTRLAIPEDAEIQGLFKGELLLKLRSHWQEAAFPQTFRQGSLVSLPFEDLLRGDRKVRLVFDVDSHSAIAAVDTSSERVVVNVFRNVQNELALLSWNAANESWTAEPLEAPRHGSIAVIGTSEDSPDFWFTYEGFLQPTSLYFVDGRSKRVVLSKSSPSFFDESKFSVRQEWSVSADGTKIPYYIVYGNDLQASGQNPTLLYGYGGFEVSLEPHYLGATGRSWLEKGGVYVIANIRGGGEFGPQWHQAALKEHRMRAFEDFISVAEDLQRRRVTSAAHLGIMGGSNGGLLVGASMVLRPDLFRAVVCQVPLLDMRRYHKLLAGNSWIAEYGDPDDPRLWKVIKKYSPYHNVKKAVAYPHVLFTTSTKDDRVHPGHARKMAAKMLALGNEVSYYENREGGHAAAADHKQIAYRKALEYSFLWEQLN